MTAVGAIGLVLVCEVLAEGALGAFAILCSAARADLARSVANDPHGALAEGAIEVRSSGRSQRRIPFAGRGIVLSSARCSRA